MCMKGWTNITSPVEPYLAIGFYIEPHVSIYESELGEINYYDGRYISSEMYHRRGELERIVYLRRYRVCA